jgi:hypothetical protein
MSSKTSVSLMHRRNTRPVLSRAGPSGSSHLFTNSRTYSTEMASPPALSNLPLEIIQKIFLECSDIESVVNLSATSHQFRDAYLGSQKLLIIENALEVQFGPLHDAIQVVTYNQSQPVYLAREPPMSIALAKQIAAIGYVAQKWERIYPMLRWRDHAEHRRFLRAHEAFRFRRALYRLWLYSKAFHNNDFLQLDLPPPVEVDDDQRISYVRRFDDDEMMEIKELNDVFQSMLINDLCPSDAIIQRRYNEGFPGQPPLYFGSYHTHPNDCFEGCFCRTLVLRHDLPQAHVAEAWGPRAAQDRTVRNVLKLEPDKLLYFKEQLNNRAERLAYLATLPESFHQYESTFRPVVENLMAERDYWMAPDHGVDGGIVDWLDEKPGGRYESSKWDVDGMERGKGYSSTSVSTRNPSEDWYYDDSTDEDQDDSENESDDNSDADSKDE